MARTARLVPASHLSELQSSSFANRSDPSTTITSKRISACDQVDITSADRGRTTEDVSCCINLSCWCFYLGRIELLSSVGSMG